MKAKTILKIFIVIMLLESCASGLYLDVNGLIFQYPAIPKSDRTDTVKLAAQNHLLAVQNREKANTYIAQGILKMDTYDTNELKLARKYFLASLTFDETRAEIWSYLADVSIQESQITKNDDKNTKLKNAIYYYNNAIQFDTMNNQYYYKRGTCFYALNDTACISDYRKACSLGNAHACDILKEVMKK
jgi:hypothetical protein